MYSLATMKQNQKSKQKDVWKNLPTTWKRNNVILNNSQIKNEIKQAIRVL